jgi:hypothetical protein
LFRNTAKECSFCGEFKVKPEPPSQNSSNPAPYAAQNLSNRNHD